MKTLALTIGVCITTIGVIGMLAPSTLVWIAKKAGTSNAFYLVAAVRIAFGGVLISAASASRAPRGLRLLGCIILLAGIATGLTGLVGMERARTIIDWWLRQGADVIRATGVVLVAIGGYVAYACAPVRRAS